MDKVTWLGRLSISAKLSLLLGFGALVAFLQGALGFAALNTTMELSRAVYETGTVHVADLGSIMVAAQSARERVLLHTIVSDPANKARLEREIAELDEVVLTGLDAFIAHASAGGEGEEGRHALAARRGWQQYQLERDRVLLASRRGEAGKARTLAAEGAGGAAFAAAEASLAELLELNLPESGVYVHKLQDTASRTQWTLGLTLAAAIAAMLALGGLVARSLTEPLRALHRRFTHISKGNLAVDKLPVVSSDELGQVAVSFNQMADGLRHFVADVACAMTADKDSAPILPDCAEAPASAAGRAAHVSSLTLPDAPSVEGYGRALTLVSTSMRRLAQRAGESASELAEILHRTSPADGRGAAGAGAGGVRPARQDASLPAAAGLAEAVEKLRTEAGVLADTAGLISAVAAKMTASGS